MENSKMIFEHLDRQCLQEQRFAEEIIAYIQHDLGALYPLSRKSIRNYLQKQLDELERDLKDQEN